MATALSRAELSTLPNRYAARQHEADAGALALSVAASLVLLGLVLLASPAAREAAPEALAVFSFAPGAASASKDELPIEEDLSAPQKAAPRQAAAPSQPDSAPAPVTSAAAPVPSTQPGPEAGGVVAVAQSLAAASPAPVSVIAGDGGGGGAGAGAVDDAGGRAGSAGNRGQRRILTASWAPDMDFSRDHLLYPRAAREQRVEGTAWLYCFVTRRDRVKDCRLIGEEPAGYGFGKAALKGRSGMRIRLHDEKGRQVHDEWVVVTKTFNLD